MVRIWEIKRLRARSGRSSRSGAPPVAGPERRKKWLEFAAQGATVVAALVSALSLYVASRAIDFQRLQGEFDTTRHQMESARRAAQIEALRASQLQEIGNRASADLGDVKEREKRANAELLIIERDLQQRNSQVADARSALDRLNKQQGITETQRAAAIRMLAQSELGAFVVAHLSLQHELAVRNRSKLVMLADRNDAAFPDELLSFSVYAGEPDRPEPLACRLSSQYFLALDDEEGDSSKRAIGSSLCRYLREDTGAVSLGSFVRAHGTGAAMHTMQLWQFLADDAPFSLTIMKVNENYESQLIRGFWNDLDAGAVVMVPKARELLAGPGRTPEQVELSSQISRFRANWVAYAQAFSEHSSDDDDLARSDMPRLWTVKRVSLRSLADGTANPTRGFDNALLCAGAWYAFQQGLIEELARKVYCRTP